MHMRVCACMSACTILSCDLVPSWQQRAVNRPPPLLLCTPLFIQRELRADTQTLEHPHGHSQSEPDCRPPTAHLAWYYYVTRMCVCARTRVCARRSSRRHLLCPLWTSVSISSSVVRTESEPSPNFQFQLKAGHCRSLPDSIYLEIPSTHTVFTVMLLYCMFCNGEHRAAVPTQYLVFFWGGGGVLLTK